jgi:small membrane protein
VRLFQLVAIPLIVVMLLLSARNLLQRARFVGSLLWSLLWIAALIAVIYPDETTAVAKTLGIRRGADLLVYCAVLGFIIAFYAVSVKLRQLSHEVTVLTRELALLDAERKDVGRSTPKA